MFVFHSANETWRGIPSYGVLYYDVLMTTNKCFETISPSSPSPFAAYIFKDVNSGERSFFLPPVSTLSDHAKLKYNPQIVSVIARALKIGYDSKGSTTVSADCTQVASEASALSLLVANDQHTPSSSASSSSSSSAISQFPLSKPSLIRDSFGLAGVKLPISSLALFEMRSFEFM